MGGESAGTSASRPGNGSTAGPERAQGAVEGQKKRGRSPADKESKRLKRYVCKLDYIIHKLLTLLSNSGYTITNTIIEFEQIVLVLR